MEKDVQLLEQFLRDFSPEVMGHSVEPLTPDLETKLLLMSKGKLEDDDRREVSKVLLSNQKALDFLVAQLSKRALRVIATNTRS